MDVFPPAELTRIERDHPKGVPASKILELLRPTGIHLSQATFRKYVQVGLLPRSRRVGQKGKHRGSRGLYPVEAVRRLYAIKKMMSEGMTLEDIRGSFLVYRNRLDGVERGLHELLDSFSTDLTARSFGPAERRQFSGKIDSLRQRSRLLAEEVAKVGSHITSRPARS